MTVGQSILLYKISNSYNENYLGFGVLAKVFMYGWMDRQTDSQPDAESIKLTYINWHRWCIGGESLINCRYSNDS